MELLLRIKAMAVEYSALDRDSLHIHVSILAFLIACVVFRKRASSVVPWLAVLALAIFGEYVDAQNLMKNGVNSYPEQETLSRFHAKDLINTMIAPTILFLAARYTRIFERLAPASSEAPEDTNKEVSGDQL